MPQISPISWTFIIIIFICIIITLINNFNPESNTSTSYNNCNTTNNSLNW